MELNLLNHYKYSFNTVTNSYDFTTKNQIIYKVSFIEDETLNAITSTNNFNNIFQIVIEKYTDELAPFDTRVSKTVEQIISAFFESKHNALLYVCSNDDSKSKIRFEAFHRWYNKSDQKSVIIKLDNILNFDSDNCTSTLYTSILYHIENPQADILHEVFNNLQNNLSEKIDR